MTIEARIQTDDQYRHHDVLLEHIPRIGEHILMDNGHTYKVTHILYHLQTNKVIIYALQ